MQFMGPDSEIEIYMNLTFTIFPITPCKFAGHVNVNPQRTCEVNKAGENSSFIFTVFVKSVPRYHFKLAYVVLQMAI